MKPTRNRVAAEASPLPATPQVIVLEADWEGFLAGRVLAADVDRLAALERDGVPHRPATDHERAIGGAV